MEVLAKLKVLQEPPMKRLMENAGSVSTGQAKFVHFSHGIARTPAVPYQYKSKYFDLYWYINFIWCN